MGLDGSPGHPRPKSLRPASLWTDTLVGVAKAHREMAGGTEASTVGRRATSRVLGALTSLFLVSQAHLVFPAQFGSSAPLSGS